MPDEIGVFSVEAKIGLGKCASLPAVDEFVKLSSMNGFASQTVKIETNANETAEVAATLQNDSEQTKFVLIQPIAIHVKTTTNSGDENAKVENSWVALPPGTPEHDRLATQLSLTSRKLGADIAFGRILTFYDGLATYLVEGGPIKFRFKGAVVETVDKTKVEWLGVKILVITAGVIPAPTPATVPTSQDPAPAQPVTSKK